MSENDPKAAVPEDLPEEERPRGNWWLRNHRLVETNSFLLLVLSFIVVTVGGIVQIVPLFYLDNTIENVEGMRPYSPLELAGRDIYVREGCYTCHSQMIRPMRDEVDRYGHYSLAAELMYDHPFQWGSKRTGPDIARVGGRYSDDWHVAHMHNPRDLVPESIMPAYPWLATTPVGSERLAAVMRAQRMSGVPYTDEMIDERPRRLPRPGQPRHRRRRGAPRPLSEGTGAQLRRPAGDQRARRADRLSADARHAGRLLDLRAGCEPVARHDRLRRASPLRRHLGPPAHGAGLRGGARLGLPSRRAQGPGRGRPPDLPQRGHAEEGLS